MKLYAQIVGTEGVSEITLDGERIASVSPAPSGAPSTDLLAAPAFIDIQVNGYGGRNFGGDNPALDTSSYIVRALRKAGVLFLYPTLVTDSHENMANGLRIMARARREDAEVAHALPGYHLEGPYIGWEDGPRGAHPRPHVRPPDWDEFQRFQEAAEGLVRIVTLAPEQPGSCAFIEKLAEAGVVAAIGHTGATPQQIADAVKAGARLSTHLGNGAHAQIARHPNYIWEQLAADELSASIIADGHHLPPSVVKCMVRCKGVNRTILTSDAVLVAGLPPGDYEFAGSAVEILPSGRVNLKGTPYLAGSGSILSEGIENAVRFAGVSLAQSVQMAAVNPALLMGLGDLGAVAPGKEASVVLFRWNASAMALSIDSVVFRGRVIPASEMGDALAPADDSE